VRFFYIENKAEIFPAHYTWKAAEKGFKMAFMMNKLAMINFCEIQVCTILVCALYSIKYGRIEFKNIYLLCTPFQFL